MTDTSDKVENVWGNRTVKIIVITLVFPTLVLAFHMVLMLPAILIGYLLIHFVGHPEFWGKVLSDLAFLPACWGAFAISKMVWPNSK